MKLSGNHINLSSGLYIKKFLKLMKICHFQFHERCILEMVAFHLSLE